jgi:hypothetical protein
MDWGLLRGTKGSIFRKILRDRIKYPPSLYYQAMLINLILRFSWLLTLVDKN